MKIKVSELKTVRENLFGQYADLLELRDKINNLVSLTQRSGDIIDEMWDINHDFEDILYDKYLEAQVETLHEALLLENDLQEVANEMESSSIYSYLILGNDYPEALYAIKQKISPETANDEPPIFYEFDYESYGDPADYVLGYDTENVWRSTFTELPDLKPLSERITLIFDDTLCPDDKIVDVWDDDVIL